MVYIFYIIHLFWLLPDFVCMMTLCSDKSAGSVDMSLRVLTACAPQQVKHLITSLGWAWICMVWKRSCPFWRNHILVALRTMHPWDLHHTSWRPWINSFWTSSRPQWQTLSSLPTNNIDSINWSASPIDFIFLVYSYIFLLFVPELW